METIDIPEIKEAQRCLQEMQADEATRIALIKMDMARRDQLARERSAHEKGIEKGDALRAEKVARKLIAAGMDDKIVADMAELPLERVQELRGS